MSEEIEETKEKKKSIIPLIIICVVGYVFLYYAVRILPGLFFMWVICLFLAPSGFKKWFHALDPSNASQYD